MVDTDKSRDQLLLEIADLKQQVAAGAEALRQSEDELNIALEAAHMGTWEWDLRTGEIIHMAGIDRLLEPYRGTFSRTVESFLDCVHPDDRKMVAQSFDRAPEGADYDIEFRLGRSDGDVRWVRAQGLVFFDRSGEAIRMIGVLMDIDRSRGLEEQLRQAQKMEAVGRLAGGVAHEFNNQLMIIGGHSELLQLKMDPADPLKVDVGVIKQAVEHAALVTSRLLAFSRKQVVQPKVLDVNSLIADAEKMLRNLIGEDIDIITTFDIEPMHVRVDPVQIQQVIINLAINARDAMPRGGRFAVTTAAVDVDGTTRHVDLHPGAYTRVTVSDTGYGMDRETLAHIFEPFFTTKGPGRGTGLGLSTVYGIVEQNGGAIAVESEPGIGTTFEIYLPRVEAPSESPDESDLERTEPLGGSETILLVEDEEMVRKLICRVLSESGYNVLEADSGEEALRVCQTNADIHLVVTDVVMPGMDGRELAQQLRAMRPEIKIIYVSGYADVLSGPGELEPFLQKPFAPDAILDKVHDVLAAPGR